mgnify:CR=1 FL=1
MRRSRFLMLVSLLLLSGCGDRPSSSGDDSAYVDALNDGVGLMGRFEFEAAGEAFARAVDMRPGSLVARLDEGISILNRSDDDAQIIALERFRALLAEHPLDPRVNYCAALALQYLGRPDEAMKHLEIVLEQAPDDAYGTYFLAQALEQTGTYDRARDLFLRATTLDPYLRSSWLGLQRCETRLGNEDAAVAALAEFEALALNPRSRLAEYRYTRMGPLSLALAGPSDPPPATEFKVASAFQPARTLLDGSFENPGTLQVVDIDGDGMPEIVASGVSSDGRSAVLSRNPDTLDGWNVDVDHPLALITSVNCMLFGDIDSDGLVDAYICREGVDHLMLQTASGSWTRVEGLPLAETDTIDGAIADLDHDGDLDVFAVNADGPDLLLNNNGDGTYRDIAAQAGVSGGDRPSRRVLVADVDLDRDADLIVLHDAPPHAVYLNDRLWSYARSSAFETFEASPLRAVSSSYGTENGLAMLRTIEDGGVASNWARQGGPGTSWVSMQRESVCLEAPDSVEILPIDCTGDGREELLVLTEDGLFFLSPGNVVVASFHAEEPLSAMSSIILDPSMGPGVLVLSDHGTLQARLPAEDLDGRPARGRYATVSFSGRDDPAQQMRSNTSGIGVRWAARLGPSWQAGATWRPGSGPGQGLQPAVIGMGGASRIDFLEIDWPDGVFQSELQLSAGAHDIGEIQRQISSCPLVFTRTGDADEFTFITDVLGVGGMGAMVSPGVTAPSRPLESLLLTGPPSELRLAEPMEEACYLDSISVLAFDIPESCELVLDERLATAPPEATSKPIVIAEVFTPDAARTIHQPDVLQEILEHDLRAVDPGPVDSRFIGLLEGESVLELQFSKSIDRCDVLLAEGWVEYPYSQTVFAAWQAGAGYRAPTLEARNASGDWVTVADSFGYPAGMPRAMALPLPRLPAGCRALRLRSNQEIYWDRIRVGVTRPGTPQGLIVPLKSAVLGFCGFPRRSTGPQRQPEYDYARREQFGDVRHQAGFYTDFGPCMELVSATDDACAIIGPGEEIRFRFDTDSTRIPAPGPGMRRHWVLQLAGWCKDMDLFTHQGERLEPLPSRGGNGPNTDARALMQRYNRRFAAGR